jgi:hypothetical protein
MVVFRGGETHDRNGAAGGIVPGVQRRDFRLLLAIARPRGDVAGHVLTDGVADRLALPRPEERIRQPAPRRLELRERATAGKLVQRRLPLAGADHIVDPA